MNREELLKHCRYYKGEDKCPFDDGELSWFWDMERVYVRCDGEFNGEGDYYLALGGRTYSEIPNSLLFVMVTSWGKYAYDFKESFPKFYDIIDKYLSNDRNH